jgi:hypothetical protein
MMRQYQIICAGKKGDRDDERAKAATGIRLLDSRNGKPIITDEVELD